MVSTGDIQRAVFSGVFLTSLFFLSFITKRGNSIDMTPYFPWLASYEKPWISLGLGIVALSSLLIVVFLQTSKSVPQ
jgi:hypothetical protein